MSDITLAAVQAALDATALQQRVAASNLANLETPGYLARRVRFADTLRAALAAAYRGEVSPAELLARTEASVIPDLTPPGPNGNNVQIERELTQLSEAGLRYEALVRLIRRKFQMLGTAIGDGRQG